MQKRSCNVSVTFGFSLSSGDAPYCTPEQYKECADPALGERKLPSFLALISSSPHYTRLNLGSWWDSSIYDPSEHFIIICSTSPVHFISSHIRQTLFSPERVNLSKASFTLRTINITKSVWMNYNITFEDVLKTFLKRCHNVFSVNKA